MTNLIRRIFVTLIGPMLGLSLLAACTTTAPDPAPGKPAAASEKMEERRDGGGASM